MTQVPVDDLNNRTDGSKKHKFRATGDSKLNDSLEAAQKEFMSQVKDLMLDGSQGYGSIVISPQQQYIR